MEELKLLVDMVGNLPSMALWVIAAFWGYKVIVIGSLYGLIRFAIDKLHSWLTLRKTQTVDVDVRMLLDGQTITGTKEALIAQLQRAKRASGIYLHASDVQWLSDAITDRIEKDEAKKAAVQHPFSTHKNSQGATA